MMMRKHWLIVNFIAALFWCLLIIVVWVFPDVFEYKAAEWWFALRGPRKPPPGIVIVSLDRQSYNRLEASPFKTWPRKYQAALLRKLKSFGAKRVALDFAFQGESDDPAADAELARAMAEIPCVIAGGEIARETVTGRQLEEIKPKAEFINAAEALADITVPVDRGFARTYSPEAVREEGDLMRFSEAALGPEGLKLARKPSSGDLINYYGPAGTFDTVSFHEVLLGDEVVLRERFRDRIVFVGYGLAFGGSGLGKDAFYTPYSPPSFFGVEVHATMAANLMEGSWIRRAPAKAAVMGMLVGGYLLTVFILSHTPLAGILAWASVVVFWGVSSYQFFLRGLFLPGLTVILSTLIFVIPASALYYYFVEYRSKQKIREALGAYVSPSLVEKIVKEGLQTYETESKAQVTLMFTDIQGFTTWAEANQNLDVLATLNRYFSAVGAIIMDCQGTIIKYAGDGIFALWGAPVAVENASRQAVRAALEIQKNIARLTKIGELPDFKTRIGIHRAVVSVGNLGEKRRFDYTAVGDGVNLAARLEELNKKYGTSVIISDQVYEEVKDCFKCRNLGQAEIRGRKETVGVYTVEL